MRQAGFLLLLTLAAAAGCEIRDDDSGLSDITVAQPDYFPTVSDDGYDDGCGTIGCCAGLPGDGVGFRCSEPWPETDDDAVVDSGSSDEDTGPPEHMCTSNVLQDGGVELGTPNPAWEEFATLLGTPICNDECSTGAGPVPYGGDWLAWFGGVQQPAEASLTQTFSVSAQTAQLRFMFAITDAAGTGDDRFAVVVDGNTVFMRTDADSVDFPGYTVIPLTLDQWADGEPHELRFESEVFGDGLTNFLVDEVELIGCGPIGPGGAVDETGTGADSTDASSGAGSDGPTAGSGTAGSGTAGSGTSGGTSG
ncbi:MAG: hypothetical protein AAF721_21855 [Myxococcota bacterium]